MIKYVDGNKDAVIVLHEIYGINSFITDICNRIYAEGYDVFCPNMLNREGAFSYTQTKEAYHTYMEHVGFDCYTKIDQLLNQLKITYQRVIILGFSIGATIAWRCSENPQCDGVICCYGSRIRDYLTVDPQCQTLLLFAKYDSFDVVDVISKLHHKVNVAIEILEGNHGCIDRYTENYNPMADKIFHDQCKCFLSNSEVDMIGLEE